MHLPRSLRFAPRLLVLASAAQTLACGVEQLPPPAAPSRELPADLDVPPEPPPRGAGRVVLDTPGEKAQVHEITGVASAQAGRYHAFVVGSRQVCTTPCVVDLPYGSHPLVFRSVGDPNRGSEVQLEVGSRPKVVRHAMGESHDGGAARVVGGSLLGLGIITGLTGALLWGIGGAVNKDGSTSGLESTGKVLTGVGAAGIVVSIPLLWLGRPTKREGATTEWSLSPGPVVPNNGVVQNL